MTKELRYMAYTKKLRTDFFSLQKRRLQNLFIHYFYR